MVVCPRVCMSHSAYLFGITLVSWYEVYVRPHYGLSCWYSHVHADVESCYLARLDLLISVVVGHAVGPAHEMCVVLLGYEEFMPWYARISVIENESEI